MQDHHQPPLPNHGPSRHQDALFTMQRATCTGLRIRSPSDARVVFHAVSLNVLPIVTRRLDTEERSSITAGSVYVWEERGPHAEATGLGIERWTDGIRWGPSRVRDGFLFYHEKDPPSTDGDVEYESDPTSPTRSDSRGLIKQTYSVFVDTSRGRKKWHLIAYFTEDALDSLRTINDLPQLASLLVPHGKYKSARSAKGRLRDHHAYEEFLPSVGTYDAHLSQHPYVPYSYQNALTSQSSRPTLPSSTWPPNQYPYIRDGSITPENSSKNLAPLAYLQNIAPPPRHPVDEKVLMMFSPDLV